MTEGVEIPITVPGADIAKLALDQIVGSFSSLEQRVIATAEKSKTTGAAVEEMRQRFVDGKISVLEMRDALAAIAAQADKSTDAVRRAIETQARNAAEAQAVRNAARAELEANRQDAAKALAFDVPDLGKDFLSSGLVDFFASLQDPATAAADAISAVGSAGLSAAEGVGKLAAGVGASVAVLSMAAGTVEALGESITRYARETQTLENANRATGLSFERASTTGAAFVSQLDASANAMRLYNAGIRLTQEQLDSLVKVATNAAVATGTDAAHAVEELTGALINGEAEGLRKFGSSLGAAGGDAHTVTDRLRALTDTARSLGNQTRDVGMRFDELRESWEGVKREASAGFLQGLTEALNAEERAVRRQTEAVEESGLTWRQWGEAAGRGLEATRQSASLLYDVIALIPDTLGALDRVSLDGITARLHEIANDASRIGAAISGTAPAATRDNTQFALAGANETPLSESLRSAGQGLLDQLTNQVRLAADPRAMAAALRIDTAGIGRKETTAKRMEHGGGGGEAFTMRDFLEAEREKIVEVQAAEVARFRAQQAAAREYMDNLIRWQTEQARLGRESAEAWGEQVTHASELARISARITGLAGEQANAEIRLQRARMAQQRAEGGIAARAETEDLRDPAAQRERIEEMRQQRALQRERSHLEQRYQLQRTYTDRMEELHGQEFDSTQALAEGSSAAFASIGEAFGKNLQAFVTGEATIGDALQGMLSDVLGSIAQQATVKGAFETAEGIAALAGVVTAGLAPGHFAAAGAYFGVAALAGLGAAAVAPSAPAAATAPAGAPRESAARLPKGGASGEGGGTVYNVMFGGPMYGTGGVRQAARQLGGVLNRGAVQGGVQLLPGVLMGGGAGS